MYIIDKTVIPSLIPRMTTSPKNCNGFWWRCDFLRVLWIPSAAATTEAQQTLPSSNVSDTQSSCWLYDVSLFPHSTHESSTRSKISSRSFCLGMCIFWRPRSFKVPSRFTVLKYSFLTYAIFGESSTTLSVFLVMSPCMNWFRYEISTPIRYHTNVPYWPNMTPPSEIDIWELDGTPNLNRSSLRIPKASSAVLPCCIVRAYPCFLAYIFTSFSNSL